MSYGLDLSDVRFETDHTGNRLKATIPYTMFSALTEFWIQARRAQTASIEASARPGQYKGSLQAAQRPTPPDNTPPATVAPMAVFTGKHGKAWANLLSHLPPEDAAPRESIAPKPAGDSQAHDDAVVVTGEPAARKRRSAPGMTKQIIFVREFEETPPDEVMQRIREGVYYIRAWRQYRRFTMEDVAELLGKTKDTVNWHENGYSRANQQTVARFAEIFECSTGQLTAKSGSNTQPWLTVISSPLEAGKPEPRSPDDTDYPDAVLGHLVAGKTPLTAWRLYRGLTIAQLADAYGSTAKNIKQLEESLFLRHRTIEKLCPVLRCKAPQLLRPASMPFPASLQAGPTGNAAMRSSHGQDGAHSGIQAQPLQSTPADLPRIA